MIPHLSFAVLSDFVFLLVASETKRNLTETKYLYEQFIDVSMTKLQIKKCITSGNVTLVNNL